ncbi:MarR family transcriptional regulator [Noviherbaspirillum cavernae]|uniref:MarR family transcriptional regulator n=1 Tax=Noviherbaspirillum cavernae TaxID=2320862 RepID=A0A418X5Y6_9BURK|nr:MarR family transcriptional regulator [Noviherbaspirillum cavernae]RJG07855.1 MarR family transcriptional regulator [Noviherbaspirillum cavernae]
MRLDRTMTYRLHLLHKLSDRESQRAYLEDAGLPMSEGRCLSAIGSFAPLSINDLAQRANLNKGQASRAAQTLVEKALVQKEASETDGRGVVLTLTRKGAQVWERVMQVVARRNAEIFGCLSTTEQKQLSEMFDRMIAYAQAGTGEAIDDSE